MAFWKSWLKSIVTSLSRHSLGQKIFSPPLFAALPLSPSLSSFLSLGGCLFTKQKSSSLRGTMGRILYVKSDLAP